MCAARVPPGKVEGAQGEVVISQDLLTLSPLVLNRVEGKTRQVRVWCSRRHTHDKEVTLLQGCLPPFSAAITPRKRH